MKTQTMIKNEIINIFSQLGLGWRYVLNGFIGGTVWSIWKKSKFWDAVRQIFVGGIVSGYSTSFIIQEISAKDAGFISFVVGIIGMTLVEVLYKWLVTKLKLLFS